MSLLNRRSFLEHTLALSATALAAQVAPAAEPLGGSRAPVAGADRVGLAVIGLHGRGLDHLDAYSFDDDVDIVALCDVDQSTFAKGQAKLRERGRSPARTYQDIRKLLEDKAVQAVSIATPNHWHTLAALWSMQSGRDAYVEKPVSHNVSEGRRLEEARVKYGRICQAGTQSRSSNAHRQALAYIRDGGVGKVVLARGLCYKRRDSIGHCDDSVVPAGVDYDLWLGPAPLRPFNKNRFHYNWHWNWEYGNGDIANQGVHQVDVARWALGKTLPKSVVSLGGRFGYSDDGQTPNTQLAIFDYGEQKLLFEVRGLKSPAVNGISVGNLIYGTEGFVALANEDMGSAVAFDNSGKPVKRFRGSGNHFSNFIAAVRTRRQEELNCPILEGHLSSALCHLANISYRLGQPRSFAPRAGSFGDDIDLAEAFGRFQQHLADSVDKMNEPLKLQEMTYQSGPRLEFDARSETFSIPQANNMLSRDYREPFVVPRQV